MQREAAAEQPNEQRRRGPRGKPFPPGRSGNPSGSKKGKRFLELRGDIVRDLGGEEALSGIDRCIVDQAVTLLIRGENATDANNAVRASNAAARLLATLRKHASPANAAPTEESFAEVARRAQAAAQVRRAQELAEDSAA